MATVWLLKSLHKNTLWTNCIADFDENHLKSNPKTLRQCYKDFLKSDDAFSVIPNWFQRIFKEIAALKKTFKSSTLDDKRNTIAFFYQGLWTPDAKICFWNNKVLESLLPELSYKDKDSLTPWFKTEVIPEFTKLYELKHDTIAKVVIRLVDFWIENDSDVFDLLCENWMKNSSCTSEYCNFLLDFLDFISLRSASRRKWGDSSITEIMKFCESQIDLLDERGVSLKLGLLQIAVSLWISFKDKFEADEKLSKDAFILLEKCNRDGTMSIRTGTLSCISFLLQRLDGPDSNHFLRLFKSMIFALIENHTFPEIKIQIVSLLQDTLHTTRLPIELLLVPFLRELQYHGYDNIDFNLVSEICRHPSLKAEDSIELASFLGSVAIQDEVFGRLARIPLLVLLHRFSKNDKFKNNFAELLDASIALLKTKTDTISDDRKIILFNELILSICCVPKASLHQLLVAKVSTLLNEQKGDNSEFETIAECMSELEDILNQ